MLSVESFLFSLTPVSTENTLEVVVSDNPQDSTMALSNQFLTSPTFKLILLTGMVLQNSVTVLVGRYTRSSVPVDQLYVVNHLIVITEIGKLFLSCVFEYVTTNGELVKSIQVNIIQRPYDAMKIVIPALLYLVQNSLLYVALSNLTAPIFQVTYQTKLVTTAIVSVLMLNQKYTFQQWVCLFILSLGVLLSSWENQVVAVKQRPQRREHSP
jgi:UDP-sugar transporter A1/2/3